MKGSDLLSIHSATALQLLCEGLSFDKLELSTLPYGRMCWPIEFEFILLLTNKLSLLIGLLQLLSRISLIDAKIESVTELKFKQNICVLYLVDHVREIYILDLNNVILYL
jgi:hypothetical protein